MPGPPPAAPGGQTEAATAPSSVIDAPIWGNAPPAPVEPTPPRRRGRMIIIALAVLLVAGGGAIGIFLGTSGSKVNDMTPSQGPSEASPAGPTLPAAPALFVADAKSGGQVDLTWSAVQSDFGVTGYTVYRDGQTLKLVNPSVVHYTDFEVAPEHTYVYEIEAVSGVGRSERASETVTTPKAPSISKARVAGSYNVNGKYTSENFTNYNVGDKLTGVWLFTARCSPAKGACNVKTAADGNRPGLLKRSGASYNGTVTIPDLGRCGSIKLDEYYDISMKVTKAAFAEGIWTATKLSGGVVVDGQFSSQCVTGHATISFTAALAG
jgi:hypothetical protein